MERKNLTTLVALVLRSLLLAVALPLAAQVPCLICWKDGGTSTTTLGTVRTPTIWVT